MKQNPSFNHTPCRLRIYTMLWVFGLTEWQATIEIFYITLCVFEPVSFMKRNILKNVSALIYLIQNLSLIKISALSETTRWWPFIFWTKVKPHIIWEMKKQNINMGLNYIKIRITLMNQSLSTRCAWLAMRQWNQNISNLRSLYDLQKWSNLLVSSL